MCGANPIFEHRLTNTGGGVTPFITPGVTKPCDATESTFQRPVGNQRKTGHKIHRLEAIPARKKR